MKISQKKIHAGMYQIVIDDRETDIKIFRDSTNRWQFTIKNFRAIFAEEFSDEEKREMCDIIFKTKSAVFKYLKKHFESRKLLFHPD